MKKTLLIAILMVISVLAVKSQTAIEPLGEGTIEIPYQISTWENLYWVSQNTTSWNKQYIQTADITFPADVNTWDGGQGLTPIGNIDTYFTGSYDGQNFSIHNIFISRNADDASALFGHVIGNPQSNLKNIIIQSPEIVSDYTGAAGLVVEFNEAGIIDNCHVIDAQITARGEVGGIVNYLNDTVSKSSFSGNLTSTYHGYVGGIAGWCPNDAYSYILNCFNAGNIESVNNYIGGLAGLFRGEVHNSYSTGNISGKSMIGGVVGNFVFGKISNTYSSGKVSGTGSSIRGFVGYTNIYDNPNSITNSFWDAMNDGLNDTEPGSDHYGAIGTSLLFMKSKSTFLNAGWDFNNTWGILEGAQISHPYLLSIPQDPPPGLQDPIFVGGDG